MPLITLAEAAAWGEKTKLAPALVALDEVLLDQVVAEVLGNLAAVVDTSTWVSSATTPSLAKTLIAKLYLAWIIDRQYSEDQELSAYAALLRASALSLQAGLMNGTIDIPGATATGDGLPSGYPTDTDPACGPYFRMDAIF